MTVRSAKQWVAVGLVKIDGHPELFGKQAGEPFLQRRERRRHACQRAGRACVLDPSRGPDLRGRTTSECPQPPPEESQAGAGTRQNQEIVEEMIKIAATISKGAMSFLFAEHRAQWTSGSHPIEV